MGGLPRGSLRLEGWKKLPTFQFSNLPTFHNYIQGVAYESDLQKVTDTLQEIAAQLPGVKKDPAPQVVFSEFSGAAIKVTLYFWINVSETGYFVALDAAVERIKAAFEQEQIQVTG